ncbi:dihydroorotase [Candidatus Peregrinibacteria bacterium CG_4_10_14_0_2_um_filter_43_11]|nr:MAG: dihydroorotase [Candidatus Peregrinibacteria bacterium CG_4_10_14_0_2_um_filter_43_11]
MNTNAILIKNGRVIDPKTGRDEVMDLLIRGDTIDQIGIIRAREGMTLIDAEGKLVIPGLIDMHVHLRDGGQNAKETIKTGTLAAVAGGTTRVMTMPNTSPPLDCSESIKAYRGIIQKDACISVNIVAAISKKLEGKVLADFSQYPALGIRFVSDDGFDIDDETLLEEAYRQAAQWKLTVMTHPEVHSIAPTGVVNEGDISQKLGVPGQPNEKEWKAVERGIRLALKTGARAHFTHLSTKESIELIRKAKRESIMITCDVTVHHLALTEESVLRQKGLAKVNPPLRTEEDRLALIDGIRDGTVDAITTDHAPHCEAEKKVELTKAAFGFSEVELRLPIALTELYFKQNIDLMHVIHLMTDRPAKLMGLKTGCFETGQPADVVIVDLKAEKTVDRHKLVSKGKNSPFHGVTLRGWPIMTIVAGEIKWKK